MIYCFNFGSTSIKISIFDKIEISKYHIYLLGKNWYINDFTNKIKKIESFSLESIYTFIFKKINITSSDIVGIRTVSHPIGYQQDKLINLTKKYLESLTKDDIGFSLHFSILISHLRILLKFVNMEQIYILSDRGFFLKMSKISKYIPIDKKYLDSNDNVYTGFHGLSVEFIVNKIKAEHKRIKNYLVCHLGGGFSITSIKGHIPIYNSMKYRPIDGLVMNKRVGDLPTSLLLNLLKKYSNIEKHFNYSSGLNTINENDNFSDLIENYNADEKVKFKLDLFIDNLISYIFLSIGKLRKKIDAIIFCGKISNLNWNWIKETIKNNINLGYEFEILVFEEDENQVIFERIKKDINFYNSNSE